MTLIINSGIIVNSGVTLKGHNNPPTGLVSLDAGTSAWQIKQDYPASTDGVYWIKNNNINSGAPFQIYADMTTNGGGWTLLVQNNAQDGGWNNTTTLLRNSSAPPAIVDYFSAGDSAKNYSILAWADYIKKNVSAGQATFDYMIDASFRGRNGGIWTANENYSFVATYDNTSFGTAQLGGTGFRKNITEVAHFDAGASGDTASWDYLNNTLEARMPYVGQTGGYIPGGSMLLGTDSDGAWWGTIIGLTGWGPVPWFEFITGNSSINVQSPQVVWYWVR